MINLGIIINLCSLIFFIWAFYKGRKEWLTQKSDSLSEKRKDSSLYFKSDLELLWWKRCRDMGIPSNNFKYTEYWTLDNLREQMFNLCDKEVIGLRKNRDKGLVREPFRIRIINLDALIQELEKKSKG